MELLKIREAAAYIKRDIKTLQRYERMGMLIPYTRTATNRRMYTKDELNKFMNVKEDISFTEKKVICYCRVSSASQKPDLENQKKILKQFCLINEIQDYDMMEEVGGGLNFKRKKFIELMDAVESNQVEKIVIAHKDRLSRFGFEFIEHVCERHGCKIVILDNEKNSPEEEMVKDLMTIIHCFSSRLYGLRNYRKSLTKALKEKKK